ncbi:hypothetical protein POSPLADRAFT_1172109 [Postia placenta MAD-698-R-SB12]|uniref:NudC domain-containing protein 1 n=1 Tax=Postia placenta MAD-698-R-SB12 TaxID=670580 RepID=A0A1X6MTZ3_9APHY|nr:hypothetical protein POSPLADRAFT_1172109 [Postia placenta MAD-698-R-SB12]OSX59845.1 hypothetical protein POSPLADRAFT_1172109 [Postia placenta MAD-698-R-SB12]
MSYFHPNRALLNPKFEGYKLSPLDQEQVVSHHALQYKPSQTNVSGRSHVTFQEVQSRISHNHLAVSSQNGRLIYFDEEQRVISVGLDKAALEPSFETLYELPKQVLSPDVASPQREYPSAAFLDTTSLFVSDGHGYLYALQLSDGGPALLQGVYELKIPPAYGSSEGTVPFRVHQAVIVDPQTALVILSAKHYTGGTVSAESNGSTEKHSRHTVEFDIWAARFPLPLPPAQERPLALDVLWHRRGADVPAYTAYDATRQLFKLVGSSAYHSINASPAPSYEPSADELAPIPRAGENVDSSQPPKPPPYSWTQTSDSVTVAIPLPSSTRTEDIKIAFTPRALTMLVRPDPTTETETGPGRPPRFDMRTLWDGIQPSTSMWTWDRAAERRFGILTLHLDKAHEGTRWSQVFAAAPVRASSEASDGADDNGEIPETLDPSELWAIREALEKYTAALRDGQDTSGLGLGNGVPSLAKDEVDDELDANVGRTVCVTWVGAHGSQLPNTQIGDAPIHLLSTPLPGTSPMQPPSLVVKNGLDGVLYSLDEAKGPEDQPTWKHTSTYSALSFVLASKQDARFTHHVSSTAVLAFESGSKDLNGNVYIYRGASPKDKWAKQAIIQVGGRTAGPLLGVAAIRVEDEKIVIACLCEDELVILRDVL